MKKYYCNCEKYCQGGRKEVSKSTFFNHKKTYRDLFTPQFQEYLNRYPVVVSEPGPSRRLTESAMSLIVMQYHISLAFSSLLITIWLGFYIYKDGPSPGILDDNTSITILTSMGPRSVNSIWSQFSTGS